MSKFGDTPDYSKPSLCSSCRSAQNIKGRGMNEEITLCRAGSMEVFRITMPVMSCSEYADRRQPPIWELEKIAWRFSVDNRKKTMGFLTPTEFKQKVKEGKEVDDD